MDNAPRLVLIKKLYDSLFSSGNTLAKLRNTVLSGRLFPGPTDAMSVAGRSLAWKLFLAKEEPLQSALPPRPATVLESLEESRKKYTVLLEDRLRAPDGNAGLTLNDLNSQHQRVHENADDLDLNNPLSLHDENPWNDWFASVELRKVISQDVERTFPDIDFYRENDVQEQLTNILFLYSSMHPSIGYRQGMHELLAPLYYAVRYDAINEGGLEDARYKALSEMCSAEFTAADSWALFELVMNGVHKWYEWRESTEAPPPFTGHIIPEGQIGLKPFIAPIVQACNHIQSSMLRACDPFLYQSMQKAGIEPQIYGIRWLRLLFTREFSMRDALILWDGLFACDPTLDLAQWICVAMLIRIRNDLIPADYSSQLTTLLRYPPPPLSSQRIEGSPHHASLLVRQALALQLAPTTETGATIVMENRTLLDIPIDTLSPTVSSPRKGTMNSSPGPAKTPSSTAFSNGSPSRHIKQQSSSAALSDFTRGLVERGESLGINKTLMNAVSEIRRNIPELAVSLGVKGTNQMPGSFPLMNERSIIERPSWEPQSRFEIEKELVMLRSRDKTLGGTLAWVVDALLQDEGGVMDAERMKSRKREALETLSYVRDVLMTNSMDLDADRLIGTEETERRHIMARKEKEELQAVTTAAALNPPMPASLTDSHSRHTARRQYGQSGRLSSRSPFRSTVIPKGNLDPSQQVLWSSTARSDTISPEVIPRPPPTSTTLRRGKTDQSTSKNEDYLDPLGALR